MVYLLGEKKIVERYNFYRLASTFPHDSPWLSCCSWPTLCKQWICTAYDMVLNVHFSTHSCGTNSYSMWLSLSVFFSLSCHLTASIQCRRKSSGAMATPFLVTGGAWVSLCLNAYTGKLPPSTGLPRVYQRIFAKVPTVRQQLRKNLPFRTPKTIRC